MDDEFEYIKSLKTDKLIEIIENIWGFEETSAALFELMERDENKTVELGVDILENGKGDDYLQATVFDFIYDLNPKATIDSLYRRKTDIGPVLLGDVMSGISIEYYREEQPKFLEGLSNDLLMRYMQLDVYEKEKIAEKYKEFEDTLKNKANFHSEYFKDNKIQNSIIKKTQLAKGRIKNGGTKEQIAKAKADLLKAEVVNAASNVTEVIEFEKVITEPGKGTVGELDVGTEKYIIEVTVGDSSKTAGEFHDYFKTPRNPNAERGVILYAPNISAENAARIESTGVRVVKDTGKLMEILGA